MIMWIQLGQDPVQLPHFGDNQHLVIMTEPRCCLLKLKLKYPLLPSIEVGHSV
jgi:hypothetical protein